MLRIHRNLIVLLAAPLLAALGQAQTNIGGALSDSTTGPLTAGVYRVTSPISLAAGQTLTIQAGAILKFSNGSFFAVNGTLLVNGAPGNKVYFTDSRDDSVGGDTNADGPSNGGAGWWYGLQVNGSGTNASVLSNFEVRYAGYGSYAGLLLNTSNATLSGGVVRDGSNAGLNLVGSTSFPTVSGCAFTGNAGAAITGVRFDALPGFSNNTATSNALNQICVTVGTLASDTSVQPANLINGAVYLAAALSVPAGRTCTLQAGTILKFAAGAFVNVDGTLVVAGASGNKVTFTDYRDDSAGGDTNGDGASSGAAGWWYGLLMNDGSDASSLDQFEVRYGGYGSYAQLKLSGCNASFAHGTIQQGANAGLDLGSSSFPTVTACNFLNNGAAAITGVSINAAPGFHGNTASGNALNQLAVTQGTVSASTTIDSTNGINNTLYVATQLNVPLGKSLTLQPGTILKFTAGSYVNVDGTLIAAGALGSPVVFTDYRDDSAGGDTNGDGASSGSAGWWYGLFFNASSGASALDYFEVRYPGYGSYPGIRIDAADIELTRGIVRNGYASGIDLLGSAAKPLINRCLLQNNLGRAISGASIGAVPLITRNSAVGNAFNQLYVSNCTVAGDLYIDGGGGVNNVVVLGAILQIPTGNSLTLGPGASFKLQAGSYVNVDGTFTVQATEASPAVFTDYRDDAIRGDSNGDGASSGSAGWWYGVYLNAGASAVDIEHLRVRFAGYGSAPSVTCTSPLAELSHCQVESGYANGFVLSAAARADFLSATGCAFAAGIRLDAGSFDLRHATVYGCAQGIQKSGALWSGSVVDSIAWGNTTNFVGLTAGQVRYSDGVGALGGLGNIDTDPLFVDAPTGDLHLQAGSPCIGAGDPASELDTDCSASDMGAWPRLSALAPSTYCTAKLNSAGCTPYLAFSGGASASSSELFTVRAFDVLNNQSGLFFYGTNGPSATPFQGGKKCVADPVVRLPVQFSGGSASGVDCTGVYEYELNALIQGGGDPALVPGTTVNIQCWYRDPMVASTTGLSNGGQFRICN